MIESFVHSFGTDSDRMCYFVVQAGTFCRSVLLPTCDLSLVQETRDILVWVEMMEDDVVSDPWKAPV